MGSLWQVTVYAAFQRAKVYSENATDSNKKCIKKLLEIEINKKLKEYKNRVSEKSHVSNIKSIANSINKQWSNSLIDGSIPIGVIQKAFNLYLKIMWCLKKIPEPPHCPLDSVIIKKLPNKHRTSWTKIKDIDTYQAIISELKKIAGKRSLAVWELETYAKPK